jgi:hypothetical protein
MKNNSISKYNLVSQASTKIGVDKLKELVITLESVINSKLKTLNGLIFRKGGRGLIGYLLKIIRGVRPRTSKSVVRQVCHFCFRCNSIAKHSGLKGLVIYLKACQVLLQQSVAKYRVLDLSELKVRPARNRAGVPLIIPAGVRILISRDKDIPSIKLWMTLFGLYRVLDFKGTLSLKTITDSGSDLSSFLPEWENFIRNSFKPNLLKLVQFSKLSDPSFFPILKSGPTSGPIDLGHNGPTGGGIDKDEVRSYTNSSTKSLILAARL